jgi:mycothiol synthase
VKVAIRRVSNDDEADLVTSAAVINANEPDWPTSVEEMRWSDRTFPGTVRFVAERDGRAIGAASIGRIVEYPPEFDGLWASIDVLPQARRHGVGGALLRAIAAETGAAGKGSLHGSVSTARPDSIAFLTHRGFVEIDRQRIVRLELAGLPRPAVEPPPGIVLTDLARRPEAVIGVHGVAVEAFPTIPERTPIAAGDLAEFRARDVDRPGIPPGAFVVALDEQTGEVVGYASLVFSAGSRTEAIHDMTAVRPAWRRRGIALAMKRATITWAIDHGLTALVTGTDEANVGMGTVNARLGYRPLPDEVTLRGTVAEAMMKR